MEMSSNGIQYSQSKGEKKGMWTHEMKIVSKCYNFERIRLSTDAVFLNFPSLL